MDSEGHGGEFNTENDGFTLKLRHGGILKLYEAPPRYVGGTIKYFYNMQIDFWGIMTLKDKVVELGYTSLEMLKLFSNTTEGIIELLTDRDAWNALNESDVVKQIEVFVVNELMIENSALVEADGENENEVQESDEDLDEFYDSEFDMEQEKVDDNDFNNNVDPTVEYVGIGEQIDTDLGTNLVVVDADLNYSDDDSGPELNEFGEEIDQSNSHKFPQFRAVVDMKEPHFSIGLTFASKEQFKEAVLSYAILNGKEIKYEKNDKIRMVAKCKHDGCLWTVTLRKVTHSMAWRITTFTEIHDGCTWVYDNSMVNSTTVAKRWRHQIGNNSEWKTFEFRDTVKSTDRLTISQKKAWRAMKKARGQLEREAEENFKKLWAYCNEIQRTNPLSTCIVKLSDIDAETGKMRFMRMYMCWEACREGFRYCRPLVGVDGCHLKGPHGGHLLTAIGVDPNDGIYPIAYAIVEGETKDSWTWFLELVKRDLEMIGVHDGDLTFISDKQKGLIPAFNIVMPSSTHRFCVRHLYGNLKVAGFTGKALKDALWTAAKATTLNSFNEAMEHIKKLDVDAFAWLADKHPTEWSMSHFSSIPMCDMLVNNISECFNALILDARQEPLINCLESLRNIVMARLFECRNKGQKWKGKICPKIVGKITINEKVAAGYVGTQCDEYLFEIRGVTGKGEFEQHSVDLSMFTCSCRKWDLNGIPCKHAICAIFMKRIYGCN